LQNIILNPKSQFLNPKKSTGHRSSVIILLNR